MMLHCRTVQFVANAARMEGRNVAVFAASADGLVQVRALGDGEQGFDPMMLRNLPGFSDDAAWVFREWHGWFHDLAQSESWPSLNAELDRLELRGVSVIVSPEQVFDTRADQAEQAVDEVAELLLGKPRRPRDRSFDEQIDAVLLQSEIRFRPGFLEDARIDLESSAGQTLTLRFPYFVDTAKRVGIMVVRPDKKGIVPPRSAGHAIYTFDKAVQAGVLTREHCVCLTGALHEGQAVAADLARSCVLLDVSDRGTPDALSRLVPT